MNKIILALTIATISSSVLAAAPPISATSNFQSSATLSASCKVSINPLSFGTITPSATPTKVNTTMTLTCSKGLLVSIAIDGGNSPTRYDRYMLGSNGNTDKLVYNVYYESNTESESWNMTNYYDMYTDGTPQPITIYGQVDGSQYVKPDNYTDNLTVIIDY